MGEAEAVVTKASADCTESVGAGLAPQSCPQLSPGLCAPPQRRSRASRGRSLLLRPQPGQGLRWERSVGSILAARGICASSWVGRLGGTPQHPLCGATQFGARFSWCPCSAETSGESQELSEPCPVCKMGFSGCSQAPPPRAARSGLGGWLSGTVGAGRLHTRGRARFQSPTIPVAGLRAQRPRPSPGASRLLILSLDKESKACGSPGWMKWETRAKSALFVKPHQVCLEPGDE